MQRQDIFVRARTNTPLFIERSFMLAFLAENLSTIIISVILVAVVTLVLFFMINEKKKGKSSCGGGCSGCPMSGNCHRKK